ncbi:uncharacterized [Tachysurus ichikawai]
MHLQPNEMHIGPSASYKLLIFFFTCDHLEFTSSFLPHLWRLSQSAEGCGEQSNSHGVVYAEQVNANKRLLSSPEPGTEYG